MEETLFFKVLKSFLSVLTRIKVVFMIFFRTGDQQCSDNITKTFSNGDHDGQQW